MTRQIPKLSLNNGTTIPAVGFGCAFGNWTNSEQIMGFQPDEAWRALTLAIESGYAHFDGAYCYGTERHLGDVLGRAMAEGSVTRDELFVTTKLAHPNTPPEVAISHHLTWDWDKVPDIQQRVRDDFEYAKEKLGLGHVDLLLMHWPGTFANKDKGFAKEARLAIWDVFETFHQRGDARAIGVCNFTQAHLEDLIDNDRTIPAINQVELHPYCRDDQLEAFCKAKGIVIEAYAPFASGAFGILKDPTIQAIADQVGYSTGQTILRWHIQSGRVVLPKSTNTKRIAENLDLFEFSLNEEQMRKIDELAPEQPKRSTSDPYEIV
jgi:diketogulonate reductase-like aldo/keto reductase